MLINIPDIDEPFCVTEHFCGDHRQNLSYRHFEIIKHGHYKSFVLINREQYATLEKLQGIERHSVTLRNYNEIWQEWVDANFNESVIKCNVTIAVKDGRYNGNYLYGFTDPDDALMFKLKWI